MNDQNANFQIETHDIWAAGSLLTRLPLPVDHQRAGARTAQATWAYPLIGAVVGAIAGAVGWLMTQIGLGPILPELFALLTLVLLTGGMHEDGLADCADGFWGGSDRARRLTIMKDSAIGTYGTLALILFALMRLAGYQGISTYDFIWVFIAIGALSRLPMVMALYALPFAKTDGLGASVGIIPKPNVVIASVIVVTIGLLCLGWIALPVILLGLMSAIPILLIALRKIGGQTGDVLGATQQCSEVGALLALIVLT